MKNAIFNMNGIYKTANRLNHYRNTGAKYSGKSSDWRYWVRNGLWAAPSNVRGEEGQMFSEYVDQVGDFIGEGHEITGGRVTGFYADSFQGEMVKFGVCKLRCPKGVLYIPVTWRTECDGSTHYLGDCELVPKGADEYAHECAKKEAAGSAEYYAEKEAEDCREDDAKYRAESDISEAKNRIHEINKKALALIAEIKKHGGFTNAICLALREKIGDYLEDRAAQFAIIAERENNFWSSVEC